MNIQRTIPVLLLLINLCLPLTAFALSNDALIDIHVSKMKSAFTAGHYVKALKSINKLKSLNIDLGVEILYFEGKALAETGGSSKAFILISDYIDKAGRNGANYTSALELYVSLEEEVDKILAAKRKRQEMIDSHNLATNYMYGSHGKKVNIKKARQLLTQTAKQGYGPSMYTLGTLLISSQFGLLDTVGGIMWWEKYVDQGSTGDDGREYAAGAVGASYFSGLDIPKNYSKAMRYSLIVTAEPTTGHKAMSHYFLGVMYFFKKYGYRNYEKALFHFTKSIEYDYVKKMPSSWFMLGRIYEEKRGVKLDIQKAKKFFIRAESLGNKHASKRLAKLNEKYGLQ